MATVDLVASTVMNDAAALMNDNARQVYTYTAQIPYLRIAMNELQEKYQLNGISSTEKSSAVIPVDAGETEIVFNGTTTPSLPDDLIEPLELWERNRNIDPFISMTKREFLPHYMEGAPTSQFVWWVWQDNKIIFLPSTADNDIKIDYLKDLFAQLVDENSIINVINARTFLEYRTAGLMAEFIERNMTSANSMNAYASLALDRALGIGVKGKQAIQTRRRPFRAGWKRRAGGW